LLASSAAQAQYTFQYGGHTIHIDPDRGTVSIPGVYDNSGHRKRAYKAESERTRKQAKENAKEENAKENPQALAPATAPTVAPTSASTEPPNIPAPSAPSDIATLPAAPAIDTAALPARQEPAPAAEPAPAPPVAAISPPLSATAPTPPPLPAAAVATAQPANSPVGLWLTEEKEGKVRIEQCGPNLCGYAVDSRSNQNAEQVLINMKPGKDAKWSGRILDPNTGSTYVPRSR
jgi:hypothetical protein